MGMGLERLSLYIRDLTTRIKSGGSKAGIPVINIVFRPSTDTYPYLEGPLLCRDILTIYGRSTGRDPYLKTKKFHAVNQN
jgi:hypothetical protein